MLARFWSADTFLFEYILLVLLIYAKENACIIILVSEKLLQVVGKEVLEFDF